MQEHYSSEGHKSLFFMNRKKINFKCEFCDKTVNSSSPDIWDIHLSSRAHAWTLDKTCGIFSPIREDNQE